MEAIAKLKNVQSSPRKMRLVADLIRGEKVNRALNILKFERKSGAPKLEKLLLSAISNWQLKNEDTKLEEADLYIKEIRVDSGRILKRLRPAPQGRAHRIRKRSNHVTLVLDSSIQVTEEAVEVVEEKPAKKKAKPSKKETKPKAKKTEKKAPKKAEKKTSKKTSKKGTKK